MIVTMDIRTDCPWCGEQLLITEAATTLVARCNDCSTLMDLADPAPAHQVAKHDTRAAA